MIQYPHAITDDSDWEPDEQVLTKYKDNPISYITKGSQRKREQIEGSKGSPRRIKSARVKAGHYDIQPKDIKGLIVLTAT